MHFSALILCFLSTLVLAYSDRTFPILMPNVSPQKPDTYFCISVRVDPSEELYITAFEPTASAKTVHHMLLFGCKTPGKSSGVYNCGGMEQANEGIETLPTCMEEQEVVYAWANDAPALKLPEGVAFKVGGKTSLQYLVLQVHYAEVSQFEDGSTDNSGVLMKFTRHPQPKSAGVMLVGTAGMIKPHSTEYMETACTIIEDKVIHPFAFRVHTHALGQVVSGYKVTQRNSEDQWDLIGKRDPQLPQMFYPVPHGMSLTKGDILAARCTMVSKRSRITRIGATSDDEMCNFYLMYWTKGETLKNKGCFSMGPPFYYWNRDGRNNIPNEDASTLPIGESAAEQGFELGSF